MLVTELRPCFAAGESYASVAREAEVGEQVVRHLPERLGLRERFRGEGPSREAPIMALSHSDIPLVAIAYGLPTDEPGRCALMESRRPFKSAEALGRLRAACDGAGGQRAWASRHSVSQTHVSQVLSGNKGFSPLWPPASAWKARWCGDRRRLAHERH
ncbi:MAG: helix-turn-helix domain-containing protein [Methylorubrum extorquens]|uniref:hypothetical protein n=1 Tax=Methylorubrum extorquens TaxID=408 RepID=UPI002FEE5463